MLKHRRMMVGSSGFIVVRPTELIQRAEGSGRRNVLGLSALEVTNRYVGVNCELWPDDLRAIGLSAFDGMAPESERTFVEQGYRRAKKLDPSVRMIYCSVLGRLTTLGKSTPAGFELLGYDFGFLISKYNHYSVLLNEVLYGLIPELSSYAALLNQNLLISGFDIVWMLNDVRDRLLKEGADLEGGEDMKPIRIYHFRDE